MELKQCPNMNEFKMRYCRSGGGGGLGCVIRGLINKDNVHKAFSQKQQKTSIHSTNNNTETTEGGEKTGKKRRERRVKTMAECDSTAS